MYESFYKLNSKPFELSSDPDILFWSPKHKNALTCLEYGLTKGLGFTLLTGAIGTGKTTLIRYLLRNLDNRTPTAVIYNTNVDSTQLLNMLLREFDLAQQSVDKVRALELLFEFLVRQYQAGRRALIIIDEAQNLPDDGLEELRMLSNFQGDDRLLLQIFLVGQPELKKRLQQPAMAQLAQRIGAHFSIAPLAPEETGAYIRFRMQKAGARREIFTPAALEKIHQASGGYPRTINLVCDAALVYGMADELEVIDAGVIEQVLADQVTLPANYSNPEDSHRKADNAGIDGNLKQHFNRLSSDIKKLRTLLEAHMLDQNKKWHLGKNQAISRLKAMLVEEQKRREKLQVKYEQLLNKYATLRSRMLELSQKLKTAGHCSPGQAPVKHFTSQNTKKQAD